MLRNFLIALTLSIAICTVLVTVYRELHGQGVGTTVKRTATFTSEEEEKLWATGVISILTPKALQRAVFFYIGKHFCIRGGEEQRRLGPSQFIRS